MSKLQAALQGIQAPKISMRELQQKQYTGAQQQVSAPRETNYSGQLMDVVGGATEVYKGYQAHREAQGLERKNEIMQKNLKPEEMRKLREDGTMLYQDDIYAMRALDKALGRQEAYAAEGVIQQRISEGYYKDRTEMEADRAALLKDRMDTMGESYGVKPGNKQWFDEGFASDMSDRSFAIYGAMDKKVDEYNRNSATLAVDNEMTELVKSGNGKHVVQVLNQRMAEGVIRTEKDLQAHLTKAAKELAQQPASIDQLREMSNQEFELFGQKTTLRQQLGEETMRSLENTAANATLNNNWKAQQYVMGKMSLLTSPDFSNPEAVMQGLDTIKELEDYANLTQGDAATALRVQIEQAKATFDKLHREWNVKQTAAITESQQQKVRLAVIDEAVNGRETGDLTRSLKLTAFNETANTGKFEKNDWNAYYDMKTEQIDAGPGTPEQKALKKLQLGVLLKDNEDSGFGAHYAEHFQRVGSELAQYGAALDANVELPPTPQLDKMMEFYKASPELFSQTFGPDFPMASAIAVSATMGVHPSIMIQGQKRLDEVRKSSPEQARQLSLEFSNKESIEGIYQNMSTDQRNAVQALYLGLEGFTNEQKMMTIDEHLNSQYSRIEGATGVIPRAFLMANPQDPKSVSVGEQRLNDRIKQRFPVGAVSIKVQGDRIKVYGSIGGEPLTYTKEMLMSDN